MKKITKVLAKYVNRFTNRDVARIAIFEGIAPTRHVVPRDTKIFITSTIFESKVYVHIRNFIKKLQFSTDNYLPTTVGVSFETVEFWGLVGYGDEIREHINRANRCCQDGGVGDTIGKLLELQRVQSVIEDKIYNRAAHFGEKKRQRDARRRLPFKK